jgi:glutathione synthase
VGKVTTKFNFKMKLVAQMDELLSINIDSDSTFAILLEAQNRGHEIFYYLPRDLNFDFKSTKLSALVKKVQLKKEKGNHCKILATKEQDLTEFDAILVRQDPPFDMNYITSTYLLEKIKDQVLILNNPSEIRNCPEKIFIAEFSNLIAPTIITSSFTKISEFRDEHKDIILKPLYSCGGDGITLLKHEDSNMRSILEMMLKTYQAPAIAQKFLPEIKDGDKRILLVDGEPVGGVARVAQKGEVRSNLHISGNIATKMNFSKRDLEICQSIGGELKKRGLFFVGIDIIGDYITEINVTSPTCIPEINALNGIKIEEIVVKKIEEILN